MSSNKELITEVNELATGLGKSVRTWGLSNTELQALADDLRRQKDQTGSQPGEQQAGGGQTGAEPHGQSEKRETKEDSSEEEGEDEEEGDYVIAPGQSITSSRGILGPGTKVSAKDFVGGQKTLDELIKRKSVVKGSTTP